MKIDYGELLWMSDLQLSSLVCLDVKTQKHFRRFCTQKHPKNSPIFQKRPKIVDKKIIKKQQH